MLAGPTMTMGRVGRCAAQGVADRAAEAAALVDFAGNRHLSHAPQATNPHPATKKLLHFPSLGPIALFTCSLDIIGKILAKCQSNKIPLCKIF
jgi:hypothetical protein